MKLMNPDHPKIKSIIEYGTQVLDATGLHNGAANTEIKWLDNQQIPCLMEINARWAGINWGDGLTAEETCVGKSIIEAVFESYWMRQPSMPCLVFGLSRVILLSLRLLTIR